MPRFASYFWVVFVGLTLIVSAAPSSKPQSEESSEREPGFVDKDQHATTLTVGDGCIDVITNNGPHENICAGEKLDLTYGDVSFADPKTGTTYGHIIVEEHSAVHVPCVKKVSFPIDAEEIQFGHGGDDPNQDHELLCIRNPRNHNNLFEEYASGQERCCPPLAKNKELKEDPKLSDSAVPSDQIEGNTNIEPQNPIVSKNDNLVGSKPAEGNTGSYTDIASAHVDATNLNPGVDANGETPDADDINQYFVGETYPNEADDST